MYGLNLGRIKLRKNKRFYLLLHVEKKGWCLTQANSESLSKYTNLALLEVSELCSWPL